MKILLLIPFVLLLLTSCSQKDILFKQDKQNSSRIVLLDLGEQNVSLLPLNLKDEKFNGDKLLEKRFGVFDINVSEVDLNTTFWAFDTYKFKENKPYFGSNFRPIQKEWFEKHIKNADKQSFGKLSRKAITTANTELRNFPTNEPIFYNPQSAGEGYPFDYLQGSTLSIGYPLFVSHLSKDKAWAFVSDDTVWGWVSVNDIAFLNDKEINELKNSNFISITHDKMPIYARSGEFLFYARVGAILPYDSVILDKFIGKIRTNSGVKIYEISNKVALSYPLKFNDENIKKIAKTMLNEPYGWGGLNKLRDCSLFTKDFMAGFGVWLPRNSAQQADTGVKISLEGLSNEQKIEIIKEKGVPYLTLLHLKGHIVLYVGLRDNKPLVLHQAWGIHTDENGRALIGQTAITTLDIGINLENVSEKNLLISRLKSATILTPPQILQPKSKKDISKILDIDKMSLDEKIKRIKRAYDVKIDKNFIIFKDGTREIFDDKKPKDSECSDGADIEDMVGEYAALKQLNTPLSDIGRCRNYTLLGKIYGKNKAQVQRNLTDVVWLKDFENIKLKFNTKNGAAKALQDVSDELNELIKREPNMLSYLKDIGGTFMWRNIAGTNRLSSHSYAIAVDINVAKSHYWRWHKNYTNLIPEKIVHIFEKHGFIWGGRWRHFDTMHFEYRPEFLNELVKI